jgi:hypothetical protein
MATAAQVIKAALQKILVQASESDLEPDEYSDAIFTLNNMMLSYDADGIKLGYTEVTDLSDDITVPVGALRGVIYNLAQELSPEYNGQITAALADAAMNGLKIMRKIGVSIPTSSYPSTLPIGSGNGVRNSDSRFYPDDEALILAETTGSIALETGTEELI